MKVTPLIDWNAIGRAVGLVPSAAALDFALSVDPSAVHYCHRASAVAAGRHPSFADLPPGAAVETPTARVVCIGTLPCAGAGPTGRFYSVHPKP